jgi:hypothetical protein
MKHLKKYNESNQEIKTKDIQETIDEILDNLSKKGELSKSEKKFMNDASKDEVINVTVPNPTGNFWADMANPHNIGIMWQNKKGVWKELLTIEDEEEKQLSKIEDSDERYERKRLMDIKSYLKSNPGLKKDLEELLKLEIEVNKKCKEIEKKYKKPSHGNINSRDYNFNQKLDYAINGTLDSLINQFGDYDDNDNPIIL